jgi:protoporphyrinogen oxidase
MKTDVLILGGGLAGLSTAYHLNQKGVDCLVMEKEARAGGTAGSVERDGFTFDHTGHLLHLHDAYGTKLITSLLGRNWAVHERRAAIHSHGVLTRYPFQANVFGLPQKVVDECVTGFLKTVHRPQALPKNPSFLAWSRATFGEGISRHFMIPYNEKLWCRPLSRMTTEWQGRFVPKPSAAEVVYGALTDQKKFFGYNASFRYPVRGGIQVLPDALAARLLPRQLYTNAPAQSVNLADKVAVVAGVGEVRYERLVNTLPLVDFLDLASPLPAAVKAARKKLRYNTVWNLNLGIKRENVTDKHWIYFPEKKFPFYRVGCQSNFSKAVAPAGASSLYIEAARPGGTKVDVPRLERQILDGLKACGILKAGDKLLSRAWMPIKCGYVVYDFARTPSVDAIFKHLETRDALSIGRYGGWKYSFMEETILDGKRAAERLAAQ